MENRVREIRKNADVANWFYVDTKNNPADLLTRQKSFRDFQNNNLWWAGASSLSEKGPTFKNNYLINDSANQEEILNEITTAVLITSAKQELSVKNVFDINKFSTLKKLYRVTAWIFRFFNNLRKTLSKTKTLSKPFTTVCELKFAELFWIKENQKQFTDENLKFYQRV